ncbi:LysR family transcriptional regulator [Aeromicrobium sp. CF4.19]|uniref:LysR family transcriptional regulator n=1 Tax=Aeromicrobium sp. CF4.19 TaxID=3373082 RepID=UPI003EE78D4F
MPRRPLPDPSRLRVLVAVADHGSIAAAARAQDVTASALSQQLTQLERECGLPLLERLPRGVALTAAGEVLVERGRAVVRALEAARSDLDSFDDLVAGRLRVGTIASAAAAVVVPALARLTHEHPGVDPSVIVLEPQASLTALLEGRLDVVLFDAYDHAPMAIPARVTATPLLVEPLVLVSDRPLPDGARLKDLADEPWVIPPPEAACGQAVRHACRQAGFEPTVRWQTDDLQLLGDAVAGGHGISLLPRLAVGPREGLHLTELERPGPRRPGRPGLSREVRAAARAGELDRPLVAAMVQALQRVAQT